MALERRDGPTALVLSRQKLPVLERNPDFNPENVRHGGYALKSFGDKPQVAIFATGSEVVLAVAAGNMLYKDSIESCVVSVPCLELFLAQPLEQRGAAARSAQCLVAIEAGRSGLWRQLVGERGLVIGLEGFGASAPEAVLAREFGLTPDQVADRIKQHLIRSAQLKENA
jgi:transketolase